MKAGRLDQVRHRVRDLGHVLIKAQKVGCWWLSRNLLLNQSIAGFGRVEMWRGGGRLNISVCRLFRLAVP
jgi:hypothetical protein